MVSGRVPSSLSLAAALLVAGCLGSLDPGVPEPDEGIGGDLPALDVRGELEFVRVLYNFGWMVATDPTSVYRYPVAVRGSVHAPTEGEGPFPVVIFMHGRHGTCAFVGFEAFSPGECPDAPPVVTPVNSYVGYDYIAENLASHGYVVLSIDANQINEKDATGDYGMHARASLILRTLDDLSQVNASGSVDDPLAQAVHGATFQGRLDMSRIGLMGHSRGGEGVAKAILANRERTDGPVHAIRAVFALAPTDFHAQRVDGVAFATLLPYCDGDVWNLHGTRMFDNVRAYDEDDPNPKIQILAMGANHNFYNTIWTRDDQGASFEFCTLRDGSPGPESGRLTAEDQRRHGLAFIAGFLRAYVGGEVGYAAFLEARKEIPEEACPADEYPCPDQFHVSYRAPAGARMVVEEGNGLSAPPRHDAGGPVVVLGPIELSQCKQQSCPSARTLGHTDQWVAQWTGSSAVLTFDLSDEPWNVSAMRTVGFRAGAPAGHDLVGDDGYQDVSLRLIDAQGIAQTVQVADHSDALFVPPGGKRHHKLVLNEIRVPLSAFGDLDLTRVAAMELVAAPERDGVLQFADVQFQA